MAGLGRAQDNPANCGQGKVALKSSQITPASGLVAHPIWTGDVNCPSSYLKLVFVMDVLSTTAPAQKSQIE